MQGKRQYQEKLFISFQLSDRVPVTNMYRRLREELDMSWLYRATAKYYGSEGQKSIDPVVFFKLLLVGYLENLGSDRKIMEHSSMRLDILYFLGYDMDEELPWHSTISRTRQLYGEEVFRELFVKVLGLCVSKGMVSGRRQAIDSAYVKANASLDSLVEKAVVADGGEYLKELEQGNKAEGVEKVLRKAEEEVDDRDKDTVSRGRKAEVEQHHSWKEEAYKGMPRIKGEWEEGEKKRERFLSNHTHYSGTDRDARISVKPGKARVLNYSMQTSVDIGSHVITYVGAYKADRRDSECMSKVLKGVVENLGAYGLIVEQVSADTGYSSGESIRACEGRGIVGYIPNHGSLQLEREGFSYNKERNSYVCSQGVELSFRRRYKDRKGVSKDEYRSSAADCKGCPLRSGCLSAKVDSKKLVYTPDKELYEVMGERMGGWYGKLMKKRRHATVEPVLGTLINHMGVRRVRTRGLAQADKFFIGGAIAYNLKKWLKHSGKKRKMGVMGVKKRIEEQLVDFFTMLTHIVRNSIRRVELLELR